MLFVRLAARAVRWRAASSMAVFLVAAAAVLAATLGPVYSRAAGASLLADRLKQTPVDQRDVVVSQQLAGSGTESDAGVLTTAQGAAASRRFGPVTMLHTVGVQASTAHKVGVTSRLAGLTSACQHLIIAEGRCPVNDSEAMLSTRTAAFAGWHVGARIAVHTPISGTAPILLRVVGLYRVPPASSAFWSHWALFDQQIANGEQAPSVDSIFLPPGPLTSRGRLLYQTTIAKVPLRVSQVRLGEQDALRAVLHKVEATAAQVSGTNNPPVHAGIPLQARLDSIDHEIDIAGTLVELAAEQLALLAVIVLGGVVAAMSTARGGEVALARLRGHGTFRVSTQALLEPVALIVLAAPVGAVLAWLVVRGAAGQVFSADTPVTFPWAAAGIAAATAGAAIVVACVAARRMLATPVADLLGHGTESGGERPTAALIIDVVVVALAAAALAQLWFGGVLTGDRPNPLAALAPTLLAAAVAVLGLRLLPTALRVIINRTASGRGMVTYLAVRQIGRRPRGSRMALLIAIATALAIVALATWSVAGRNRQYRALNQVGASRVLTVTPKHGVDLMTAVRRADPSGSAAMAVAMFPVSSTQLMAVDSPRLPGIAAWRPDYSTASLTQIVKTLHPTLPQPVLLRGTVLEADVRLTAPASTPVTLVYTLLRPGYFADRVSLGPVRSGQAHYRAALPVGCHAGCRVTGLTVQRAGHGTGGRLSLTVTRLRTDGPSTGLARLATGRFWRSTNDSGLTLISTGAGFALSSPEPDSNGTWGVLGTADVPDALPAVVAPETASVYPGEAIHRISAVNLDGGAVAVDGATRARALPRLDRSGLIVDLTLAERAMSSPQDPSVVQQVWLSASAPADLVPRLQQQGLRIDSTASAAAARARLDRTGPALADAVFVIAAVAAALLAIAAAALGGLLSVRRRAYDLAALWSVGVPRATLRRATAVEQAIVVGSGLLLGAAAGLGGAVLAVPSTPVFTDTNIGPPLETGLPQVPLAVLVGVLTVTLGLTCTLLAAGIARLATADRLREAGT